MFQNSVIDKKSKTEELKAISNLVELELSVNSSDLNVITKEFVSEDSRSLLLLVVVTFAPLRFVIETIWYLFWQMGSELFCFEPPLNLPVDVSFGLYLPSYGP